MVVKKATKAGLESMTLTEYAFVSRRTIYLLGEIDDKVAAEIISQLEYLDETGEDDIRLVINSPGGSVSAGLAIVDAMERCGCEVSTTATGIAASMAALIFACGARGKRYVTPRAEVMIHQPLGGVQGQASDIELVASHILRTRTLLNNILAEMTGRPLEQIARDCDRDYFMTAREAVDYGIADSILERNIWKRNGSY